jgi:hypothetical protein
MSLPDSCNMISRQFKAKYIEIQFPKTERYLKKIINKLMFYDN